MRLRCRSCGREFQISEVADQLDEQLQELLSERADCAKQVAETKLSEDSGATFYRPEREAEVLRRVRERNKGPLSDDEMVRLFREEFFHGGNTQKTHI